MGKFDTLKSITNEVTDAFEETFLLYANDMPSLDLGMVDGKAETLKISINGRDLTIRQSPAGLRADRDGGTTGAVVWMVTPLFAEWISSRSNLFFEHDLLGNDIVVLELGCGVSGITALALAPLVQRYVLTDQEYVMKILRENIAENVPKSKIKPQRQRKRSRRVTPAVEPEETVPASNIDVLCLDWELSDLNDLPSVLERDGDAPSAAAPEGFDVIIACDCIYNEHLVEPFVETCAKLCELSSHSRNGPTICIVAQQLRSSDIFELWLSVFISKFHVWRIPDDKLSAGLAERSGFVIHVAVLK